MGSRRIKPKKLLAAEIAADLRRKQQRFLDGAKIVLKAGPAAPADLVARVEALTGEDFGMFLPLLEKRALVKRNQEL